MERKSNLAIARFRRSWLWLALLPLLLAGTAQAAGAPTVDDRAGLFSAATTQKANQVLEHIYRTTAPAKEVAVERPKLAHVPKPVGQRDDLQGLRRGPVHQLLPHIP